MIRNFSGHFTGFLVRKSAGLIPKTVLEKKHKKFKKTTFLLSQMKLDSITRLDTNGENRHTGPDTYDQRCNTRSYGRGRSAIC